MAGQRDEELARRAAGDGRRDWEEQRKQTEMQIAIIMKAEPQRSTHTHTSTHTNTPPQCHSWEIDSADSASLPVHVSAGEMSSSLKWKIRMFHEINGKEDPRKNKEGPG